MVDDGGGRARSEVGAATCATPGDEALVAEVARLLRARGERMTGPRRAVVRALAERPGHVFAEGVVQRVAQTDPTVHRASVYRTLEALSDLGAVQHVHVGHGGTAYHLLRSAPPHLHASCRSCGTVRDLPAGMLDAVAALAAGEHDFHVDATHVALSGTCGDCERAGGG